MSLRRSREGRTEPKEHPYIPMNLTPRALRASPAALAVLALAVTVSLSAGAVLADGPRPGAPWPQLKRDGNKSSISTVNGPATLAQRWISNADGAITGGPIVGDDGTIYVTTDGPRLVAFRPDGTRKFAFTPGGVTGRPTFPLINAKGVIMFGTEDGYVIGATTEGNEAWRFDTVDAPYGSSSLQTITAPLGAGSNYSRVLVGTYAGNVYELDDGSSPASAAPTARSAPARSSRQTAHSSGPHRPNYLRRFQHRR